MSNPQKPLSYLSTKCVLQLCKADLRILISMHIPSLRHLEKSLPLRIEKLHLEPYTVRINETEFRLEAIRKFPESPPFGSFQCDLDEYGVPEKNVNFELTPGDVRVEQKDHSDCSIEFQNLETLEFIMSQFTRRDMLRWDDPIIQRKPTFTRPEIVDPSYCNINIGDCIFLENDWGKEKIEMQKYLEKNTSGNENFVELGTPIINFLRTDAIVDAYSSEGPLIIIAHRPLTRIQRISVIEQLQAHILPLQHRHFKRPPAFKRYLKLTTVFSCGKNTEIIEYKQNIQVAMKYLNEKIFGERGIIHVDHLGIGNKNGVLRLPILKLKINHLRMQKNWKSVMENVLPILEKRSFPLKSIESLSVDMYDENHGNQIVREAEMLICPDIGLPIINWELTLTKLFNQHIHLPNGFMSADKLMVFIHWFVRSRQRISEIGATFTFGVFSSEFSEELYSLLLERPTTNLSTLPEVIISSHFPYCFTIPLTDLSELNVYGVSSSKKFEENQPLWILTVQVMKIYTAIVLVEV